MAEGAALLVDQVLPAVGYRQWVLSFQGSLAVRLGYDPALLAKVAESLAQAVMRDMRRAVKERHGLASVAPLHAGVFTAVQRFRSDLGLYVHLHCLITVGAYDEGIADIRFLPAATPTAERMQAVLAQVHEAIAPAAEVDDAVQTLFDGRVRVHFKAPWRSGAAHADMSPDKFLTRLCGLVPPPGLPHDEILRRVRKSPPSTRAHHPARRRTRARTAARTPPRQRPDRNDGDDDAPVSSPTPSRIAWAKLLARVFALDVIICRKCGSRMRVLEVVDDPDHIARILHGARAPPRTPGVAPAPGLSLAPSTHVAPHTFTELRAPVNPASPFRGRARLRSVPHYQFALPMFDAPGIQFAAEIPG